MSCYHTSTFVDRWSIICGLVIVLVSTSVDASMAHDECEFLTKDAKVEMRGHPKSPIMSPGTGVPTTKGSCVNTTGTMPGPECQLRVNISSDVTFVVTACQYNTGEYGMDMNTSSAHQVTLSICTEHDEIYVGVSLPCVYPDATLVQMFNQTSLTVSTADETRVPHRSRRASSIVQEICAISIDINVYKEKNGSSEQISDVKLLLCLLNQCDVNGSVYYKEFSPPDKPCRYCNPALNGRSLSTRDEWCFIEGNCTPNGQHNPNDDCQKCSWSTNRNKYSKIASPSTANSFTLVISTITLVTAIAAAIAAGCLIDDILIKGAAISYAVIAGVFDIAALGLAAHGVASDDCRNTWWICSLGLWSVALCYELASGVSTVYGVRRQKKDDDKEMGDRHKQTMDELAKKKEDRKEKNKNDGKGSTPANNALGNASEEAKQGDTKPGVTLKKRICNILSKNCRKDRPDKPATNGGNSKIDSPINLHEVAVDGDVTRQRGGSHDAPPVKPKPEHQESGYESAGMMCESVHLTLSQESDQRDEPNKKTNEHAGLENVDPRDQPSKKTNEHVGRIADDTGNLYSNHKIDNNRKKTNRSDAGAGDQPKEIIYSDLAGGPQPGILKGDNGSQDSSLYNLLERNVQKK